MAQYTYTKSVDVARLQSEIQSSTISVAVDTVSTVGTAVTILFKSILAQAEIDVLDALVAAHVNTPLAEDNVPVVEIYQGKSGTGGSYQAAGERFDIPAGSAGAVETFTWSWPFPIRLFTASWVEQPAHAEAELSVKVAPNSAVGQLTGPTAAGDGWLDVAASVLQYIFVGYHVSLSDGASALEMLGAVVEIDTTNNRIRMDIPPQSVWLVGSVVLMSVVLADKLVLSGMSTPRKIGGGKVGGSLIAANTPLELTYKRGIDNAAAIYFAIQFEIDY